MRGAQRGQIHYRALRRGREALSPLPPAGFSCVRWETRRCSRQGTFTVGGIHRYSAGPAYAGREVAVALGAFRVTICDCGTGEAIAAYGREWCRAPTDSSDPVLQLKLLCMRPNGWRDSSVRLSLPDELVSFLDGEPRGRLQADLRVLRDESSERGWKAAVEGMLRSLRATGSIDRASVAVSAARAQSGDARTEYDEEVDLGVYDRALRILEGGAGDAHDQLVA